ncbi:hypothetical protein AK88_04468 [Plasmodium fragile]|uniref:Uncharacterized protein n=1 Tax=Plasmodium fragile TaxID=5857 RepID=A0A0D9QJH2_PLAFR|nr:uncharacterized protein AK88_04468 [Plasmodium fragile]KJP85881.1 hypothetical protein AK88_04468 [Plasmodium fragile]
MKFLIFNDDTSEKGLAGGGKTTTSTGQRVGLCGCMLGRGVHTPGNNNACTGVAHCIDYLAVAAAPMCEPPPLNGVPTNNHTSLSSPQCHSSKMMYTHPVDDVFFFTLSMGAQRWESKGGRNA